MPRLRRTQGTLIERLLSNDAERYPRMDECSGAMDGKELPISTDGLVQRCHGRQGAADIHGWTSASGAMDGKELLFTFFDSLRSRI